MITPKCFCVEYLFQIISIDSAPSINIIVHIITISVLEGVQLGKLIVLYHTIPISAKYDAADAVIKTKRGIIK